MSIALFIGSIIGLSLGLLGGGGSVLMTPALVYAGGFPATEAIGMSLAVVGGTSLLGGLLNLRRGLVHYRAAVVFSLAGMTGAVPGSMLTGRVPQSLLLGLFGLLMITVASLMLWGRRDRPKVEYRCRIGRCVGAGLGVGFLTGFLGVGGGFVIVPALMHFGDLRLREAVGTSLVVIAISSFTGLAGHAGQLSLDWALVGLFLGAAMLGMLGGASLADRLPAESLKKSFAWLVLGVAVFVIFENWMG